MNTLSSLLSSILDSPPLHAKWLNTLSYLENCGARKIAACEHPTLVKEEMLKHAAEEFRHAHYLKRQIEKLLPHTLGTYHPDSLLGGFSTLHYLSSLDLQTCRYLKEKNLSSSQIKETAYLLVTYAIELRALELYPVYDTALRCIGSNVHVKSILLEETEHLKEMEEGLRNLPHGPSYIPFVCSLESSLYQKWVDGVARNIYWLTNQA